MKAGLRSKIILFNFMLFGAMVGKAQSTVYASYVTDSSADIQNAYKITDSDLTNYGDISNILTLLSSSYIRAGFTTSGKAGDAVNVIVQGTGALLNAGLLTNITIRLYDSSGNNVANGSGSSLLQLSVLSPSTNTYVIRFLTDPTDTFTFSQVSVEFNNILSASLLSELRIYNISYQQACPAILADSVYTYGTNAGLAGYVTNAGNAVDLPTTNFAVLAIPLNILSLLPPAYLDLRFSRQGNGGDYLGFTVAQGSSLLSASLLGNINLTAYDTTGSVVASKNGFTLADLKLLAGTSDKYTVGFKTPAGSYKISRLSITLNAFIGLFEDLNVYNAFHYDIDPQTVTILSTGSISSGSASNGSLTVCAGDSITLTAIDSAGGKQYLWSNGATTQSITIKTSGNYSVQVMDSLACDRYSIPITVTVLPTPSPVITGDSVLCAGKTGTLTLTTGYKTYLWSNSDTTASVAISNSGKYYVTVTDSNQCQASDTINVQHDQLNIAATITQPTCSYSTNGGISLLVSGGGGAYTYLWNTDSTGNTIARLSPAIYNVTIDDTTYHCLFPLSYTVTAKNDLSIRSAITNASDTEVTDGSISTQVIGGSGSYSYLWSNGATTPAITGTAPGIYTVKVTDNISGCILNDTLAVNENNDPLILTITTTNNSACNTATGTATVVVTDGSGSYSYLWSNGATTSSVSGLSTGVYYVTVHDILRNYTRTGLATISNSTTITIAGVVSKTICDSISGSIITTVSGGSGSYSYLWSNGDNTANISAIPAGTYQLFVTDNINGCGTKKIFEVSQAGGPTVTLNSTEPACNNNANGSITISPATVTDKYIWSTGATTNNITGLSAGTYNVTITDTATGCSSYYSALLTEPEQINITATKKMNSGCSLAGNGSIAVVVNSGTAPFRYAWNTGANTAVITNLSAGSYMVNVTDTAGCNDSLRTSITDDSSKMLHVTIDSTTRSSCATVANGSAKAEVTGGSEPYTYHWSNGAVSRQLINVLSGVYSVTVTDATGCTTSASIAINTDTANAVQIVIDSLIDTKCNTANSGKIYTSALKGKPPYTYLWSTGATTAAITGIGIGSYSVTVTDSIGCKDTANAAITIDTANSIKLVIDSAMATACNTASTGMIYTHAVRGSSPYTYIWNTGASTANISGLAVGSYSITATDASGCTTTASANVTADTANAIHIAIDSTINTKCSIAGSGKIYTHTLKGKPPYTYLWSTGSTTPAITGIGVGTYSITATDSVGCKATTNATITIDTTNIVRLIVDSIIATGCGSVSTGRIYSHAVSGSTPYTYLWNTSATTANISGLSVGSYSVTVTDATGCKDTAYTYVPGGTGPLITIDSTSSTSCPGANNGKIATTVTSGTLPYSYRWSSGASTADLSGAGIGTYTLTVTDAAGCKDTITATITPGNTDSVRLIVDSVIATNCSTANTGRAYSHAIDGNSPYTYLWSNGPTTANISALAAGTYSVTVTDATGCKDSASVYIASGYGPAITIDSVHAASCSTADNGKVYVNITGGITPYSYYWASGVTTADLINVSIGSYTLTVTDAAGCKDTATAVVDADSLNKVHLIIDSVISNDCNTSMSGSIYTHAIDGYAPYTYMWSTGRSTANISSLSAGTYSVTVTDAVGCKDTATARVPGGAGPGIAIDSITAASCYTIANGAIDIAISGGTIPYSYHWSNGSTTANLSNISGGYYTLTVTDALGCMDTATAIVSTDTANAVHLVLDSVINTSCNNARSGKIYTHGIKGLSPYTYLWNTGTATPILSGLVVGTYNEVITDATGCKDTVTAAVSTGSSLNIGETSTNVKCNGDSTGTLNINVTGGSGQYSYTWSNGATTAEISNIPAGDYTITITDKETSCSQTDTFIITQPGPLQVKTIITNENCNTHSGSVALFATGGTAPYTYLWMGNNADSIVSGLAAGDYSLTITDADACNIKTLITVGRNNCDSIIDIHNVITPNGDGVNDVWVIDGILNYPDASVQIFDKWGDIVYSKQFYSNTWDGTDKNGKKLSSGTYYYLVKLNAENLQGGKNVFTGYIMVQQ